MKVDENNNPHIEIILFRKIVAMDTQLIHSYFVSISCCEETLDIQCDYVFDMSNFDLLENTFIGTLLLSWLLLYCEFYLSI